MIRSSAATLLAALFLACGPSSKAPTKCATGQSVCLPPGGGAAFCADISLDPKNCGACNLACPSVTGSTSVACHTSECVADCGGGFSSTAKVVCGGKTTTDGGITAYCTDTSTDHENCGICGAVCTGAEQCQAGKCTAVSGSAACGGSGTGTTYANLQIDRANCGACGNACATSEVCSDSACNPCPVGQCSNACVDTQHDPKNCGTCGNVVPSCENGAALGRLTIDKGSAPFKPAVVGAPGLFGVSVKVHSQARVVRVTATVATTVTELSLVGPVEEDPTLWSGNITVPATATVEIIFDAYDELYLQRAADAGFVDTVHSDEQKATATVLALPGAAATPAAPNVQAQTAPPVPVGAAFKWVPINGPALQFSVSVPSGAGIATVDLLENNLLFGTATVNGNGGAVFSALPAQVGLGDLSVTACPFDLAGQPGPCSPATTFTVGRIAPLTAPAVIGKNADATGGHTIYYVNPSQQLFAQGSTDLDPTSSDQPGKQIGGATYYADALRPVPEGSGVYSVKVDGTGVDRLDGPTLVKSNYVTPPPGVTFRGIDLVTPVALAICDTAAGPNAVSYFATASAAQTTALAVAAGISISATNVNRKNLTCPAPGILGAFPNSGQPGLQTARSGAIVGWFKTAAGTQLLLFHPAIAPSMVGNHVASLIAPPGGITVGDLQTFPGGEIVFQFTDTATGNAFLGAAYFDGTSQPVVLPPQQIGPTGAGTITPNFFFVAKPGLVLGLVNAATAGAGQQAVEILLKGAAPKMIFPAPSNGTTAGPVLGSVQSRTGSRVNFAISDDQTKALFVTADQVAGAPDAVRRTHLLDLATGTDTPLGASPNNAFAHFPHFVHSAPVFTGGVPAGAHQYVLWTENLPLAPGQVTSHERISFANFQGAVSTVDRLNSFAAANSLVESAAGGVILFLSQSEQGGADLYSVPLVSASGPVTATRVMDHVFWFKTREDKQRLLVARSDGTLYVAPLAPGANLAQRLVPLVNAGFLGDAPILNGQGIGAFGFTPDGDHAYVLRDATASANGTTTGIVETIDFTTGSFARTDFGRAIVGDLSNASQPIIGFVGGATTAILLDQLSVEANDARLAIAPPSATTSRVDTGALPAGFQFNSDFVTFFSSADNNEGLMLYQAGFFLAPVAPGAFFGSRTVRLQNDGTFDVLPSGSIGPPSQPATSSPFGGPFLPDWSLIHDRDEVTSNSFFKVWGGLTPAKFIQVSRNFNAQINALGTVITPDLKELLYSFVEPGDLTRGYTIALPLPGHTPPDPLLP